MGVILINNIDCLKVSKFSGLFVGIHYNGSMFVCCAFVEFNFDPCATSWDFFLVFCFVFCFPGMLDFAASPSKPACNPYYCCPLQIVRTP